MKLKALIFIQTMESEEYTLFLITWR